MFWVLMIIGFLVITIESLVLYFYRVSFLEIMTDNQAVIVTAKPVLLYYVAKLPDSLTYLSIRQALIHTNMTNGKTATLCSQKI
mgnify:CR=1 FL=1